MQSRSASRRAVTLSLIGLLLGSASGCRGASDTVLSEGDRTVEPGLELRVHRLGESGKVPEITAVYFDPQYFDLDLLTAQRDGPPRSARRWCRDEKLTAAINASMHLPNNRSTGWMIDDDVVNNPTVNSAFGGVLAFDPHDPGSARWRFVSKDCEDSLLARLPEQFSSVVQNYRLLDCRHRPIEWADLKSYSVAAIGLDRRGWLVLLHSGEPCRVSDFAKWIADPVFDLVAAHFVEGGPQASLFVQWQGGELERVGRYQGVATGRARDLPNVLGLRRVAGDEP